jgi:integrase
VSARKSFVLVTRFNSKHPTRRTLGAVGKISLDDARDKARDWYRELSKGVDPKRARSNDLRFSTVRDQFYQHIAHHRQANTVKCIINRELKSWSHRPLSSITKRDVIAAVEDIIGRGTPCAAHHLLAHMRRLFNYACARDHIEHSPCDRVKASVLIGPRVVRQRVLNDNEMRALWRVSALTPYPYGPLWQLILVTGVRRSEAVGARWCEFDLKQRLWTIPPERFKSNAAHFVPLPPLAMHIVAGLPQRERDDLLFSMKPKGNRLQGLPKAKRRLDEAMQIEVPFMIHDLRRTVRTRLSALRVPDHIAEMIIGHGRKGIARVYDQHRYQQEMREALDAWSDKLSTLVQE